MSVATLTFRDRPRIIAGSQSLFFPNAISLRQSPLHGCLKVLSQRWRKQRFATLAGWGWEAEILSGDV